MKSATDNIGTFDKRGDIRYSKQLDNKGKEFGRADATTADDEKSPPACAAGGEEKILFD